MTVLLQGTKSASGHLPRHCAWGRRRKPRGWELAMALWSCPGWPCSTGARPTRPSEALSHKVWHAIPNRQRSASAEDAI